MAEEQKQPDWLVIEKDYRAGIKSLRQIAGEHDITEGAIRKRAKRDEWTRDLAEKIRQKTEELVRKEAVRSTVRKETEGEIIASNAVVGANVVLAERRDLVRLREMKNAFLDELGFVNERREEYEAAAEALREGDSSAAIALQKAISLPSRVLVFEKLVACEQKIQAMEREAYGIDKDEKKDDSGYEAMLMRAIAASESGSQE